MGKKKQIGVYINLVNCKLIRFLSSSLKDNDINLTTEQFVVMDTLWQQGKMPQSQIAQMMHKDKNSITQFIDLLEHKKLVRRCKHPTDKRINDVEVTEIGQALHEKTHKVATSTMSQVLKDLSKEELDLLEKILCRIDGNIDEAEKAKNHPKCQ